MSKYRQLAASGPDGLSRELSLPELTSFGVSSSAPMTVVAGASPSLFALAVPGVPLLFLGVGAIAALWAVGYAALSRHVLSAGAQATFIARGLGKRIGIGAQGMALVSYGAIYLCLYGLFGSVVMAVVEQLTGFKGPWWMWALAGAVGVGLLGRTRVKIAGKVLAIALSLEVAAVVLVDVAGFSHPAGGHIQLTDITPSVLLHHGTAGLGGAIAYVVACLIGFEETPGLAEDARNGKRDVRRALLTAAGFLGTYYAASYLAISVGVGPQQLAAVAQDKNSGLPINLVAAAFGPAGQILADVALVLLCTSVFAALASFHTVVVRYVYAAGRDQVLPKTLSRINRHNSSPSVASHVVSLVALAVIAGFAVSGRDPVATLFAWGSYIAAVGVLALMIGSSAAVVGFFNRSPHLSPGLVVTAVAPIVAAIFMFALWVIMLASPETMINAQRLHPLHLTLIALPFLGLAWGLARARTLRRRSRATWNGVAEPTFAETGVRYPLEVKTPEFATDEYAI